MGIRKLTDAQRAMLAGDKGSYFFPKGRWRRELVMRALFDKGLIDPKTGIITEAGTAVLANKKPPLP